MTYIETEITITDKKLILLLLLPNHFSWLITFASIAWRRITTTYHHLPPFLQES